MAAALLCSFLKFGEPGSTKLIACYLYYIFADSQTEFFCLNVWAIYFDKFNHRKRYNMKNNRDAFATDRNNEFPRDSQSLRDEMLAADII